MEQNFIEFFHVSEHVDHFKAIKVCSLRKKTEMVWSGGTSPLPPPIWFLPYCFRFFLMEASLREGVKNTFRGGEVSLWPQSPEPPYTVKNDILKTWNHVSMEWILMSSFLRCSLSSILAQEHLSWNTCLLHNFQDIQYL